MNRFGFAIVLLCSASGASAHHAAAPHFVLDSEITLRGVVTELKLVNPHSYFYFDATDENGATVNWRCEMPAAAVLRRVGWTPNSLKPGQSITVNGAPARREEHVCYLNFLTLADGTRIARDGGPAGASTARASPEPSSGEPPARYLASGRPNLSGLWVAARGPGGPPRPGGARRPPPGAGGPAGPGPRRGNPRPPPGAPVPTAAGAAAAAGYEQPFDDPGIFCHSANIIFAWTHDQHVNEVVQESETITLNYGYMDLIRTVHLDEKQHPENIVPSVAGHSIGHWEGDALVVDTIGFEAGVLIPINGLQHSGEMQVSERFELSEDGETLIRRYIVHDPAFLQADWIGTDDMRRTNEPHVPYDCTELSGDNNRRPGN